MAHFACVCEMLDIHVPADWNMYAGLTSRARARCWFKSATRVVFEAIANFALACEVLVRCPNWDLLN